MALNLFPDLDNTSDNNGKIKLEGHGVYATDVPPGVGHKRRRLYLFADPRLARGSSQLVRFKTPNDGMQFEVNPNFDFCLIGRNVWDELFDGFPNAPSYETAIASSRADVRIKGVSGRVAIVKLTFQPVINGQPDYPRWPLKVGLGLSVHPEICSIGAGILDHGVLVWSAGMTALVWNGDTTEVASMPFKTPNPLVPGA